MTLIEKIAGVIVVGVAFLAIYYMIMSGFKIAMDAVRDDARRAANLRAHRLADKLYRERIKNTRLNITQKIVVVEENMRRRGEI